MNGIILVIFSFIVVHCMRGELANHWTKIFSLTPDVLVGAQHGAKLSNLIIRLLGLALLSIGIRLVWR